MTMIDATFVPLRPTTERVSIQSYCMQQKHGTSLASSAIAVVTSNTTLLEDWLAISKIVASPMHLVEEHFFSSQAQW
ncbi:MAG: hypothetical protein SH847_15485 [Roseiflexaceae bacterium]|nr:hypothetical protein [Roseiflexaceae bacterium]